MSAKTTEAAKTLAYARPRVWVECKAPSVGGDGLCGNLTYGYPTKRYCSRRCIMRAWRAQQADSQTDSQMAARIDTGCQIDTPQSVDSHPSLRERGADE